jgi:hypothetical protein
MPESKAKGARHKVFEPIPAFFIDPAPCALCLEPFFDGLKKMGITGALH